MIKDHIRNVKQYYGISEKLDKALGYLFTTNFSEMLDGTYPIEGDAMYAMVQRYQTLPFDENAWETHRDYIDIQLLVSGVESLGVNDKEKLVQYQAYDQKADYILWCGQGDFIQLTQGDFVILWPDDAHMPRRCMREPENVVKVVVKVRV